MPRHSSVLESTGPALVWFYDGTDCPQCEELAPIVDTASRKLSSWGVYVSSVDVSKETRLRRDLSIPKGLPMMFKVCGGGWAGGVKGRAAVACR